MCEKTWFKDTLQNAELIDALQKISLIITDIDGCLTDGRVYYKDGKEIEKGFSIQDGFLISKCNKENMPHIAFLTGRSDQAATSRAKALAIPDELYYQGISHNKAGSVREIQKKVEATKEHTLFFGDDILDLQTKDEVAVFASPANALFYVKDNADIVVPKVGSDGSFRLLLDLILYVQQKHIMQGALNQSLQCE